MALFAITRGQFSMIDAAMACIDQVGECKISLWTWTVAEYEVQCLERPYRDSRVKAADLIIDHGARNKNMAIIRDFKSLFGPNSVRYVLNHSKICTIESADFKLLLRGSMNLNHNPRFEQFDITEGGADFDLVKEIEQELDILDDDCTGAQVYKQSRVADAFDSEQLSFFKGIKVRAK